MDILIIGVFSTRYMGRIVVQRLSADLLYTFRISMRIYYRLRYSLS